MKARRGSSSSEVSAKWRKLLGLLPQYDPFRDADGCWFDEAAAQLALDFFPECLRHVEGEVAGQPFVLQPWQQSYTANLFGWKCRDEKGREVRRYRESLLFVPRKNGKTPYVAGLAIVVLFCDDEIGQQNYIAAGDREQAGMLFRHAKGMVEQEEELSSRSTIYGGRASAGQSKSIVREETNSFLRVISADADTKHGGNTHLAVVDELHVQPNRELVDVLSTSMASANRKQPLLVFITTADYDRPSICNEKHLYASQVRDGRVRDPRFLPAIWEAEEKDDWCDEKVWAKVNPNLGVSVSLDYLRRECEKAKINPALEYTFKRLHLNLKTQTAVKAIDLVKWDACDPGAEPLEWRRATLERLKGCSCWAGLDLGSTSDLTALALLFRENGEWILLLFFWVPRHQTERRRRDGGKASYDAWIKDGWIRQTEGAQTDYAEILADIQKLADVYNIQEIAVDRLLFGIQVCTDLRDAAFNVIAYGQGYASMAGPVRQMLDDIGAGHLHHGNDPVLRWMAGNASAELSKRKGAEGHVEEVLKFSKQASADKIDGLVATCMSLGLAMLNPTAGDAPSLTVI